MKLGKGVRDYHFEKFGVGIDNSPKRVKVKSSQNVEQHLVVVAFAWCLLITKRIQAKNYRLICGLINTSRLIQVFSINSIF